MAHHHPALNAVKGNMPLVRNSILLNPGAGTFEQVCTRARKEQLQQQLLDAIKKAVALAELHTAGDNKGKSGSSDAAINLENVSQVYFTSISMQ